MLSRVAESIYWLNRYLERAENYARFIDVNFNLALELHPDVSTQWRPLIEATGDFPAYRARYGEPTRENAIRFLGFDADNPNSVYASVLKARENARAIRSEITREVWEQINALYYFVKDAHERERWREDDPRDYFAEVKRSCHIVWGLYESTVSQSEAYHFSRLGRLLERADKTSRILDIKYLMLLPKGVPVGSTFDLVQWSALLKSVSAYDMFKKQYGMLTAVRIIEYLLFDPRFPRSIYSCLTGVERSLKHLSPPSERLNRAQKKLGQIRSHLEYGEVEDIIESGLHEYLDGLQTNLNELSASLFDLFFSVERQLARLQEGRQGSAPSQTQSQTQTQGQSQSQSQSA